MKCTGWLAQIKVHTKSNLSNLYLIPSGYYTRIENFEEINEKVLHYIEVMARPMVMYQTDHPIQWTSAYVGGRVRNFNW